MAEDQIEEIKRKVDIVELISEHVELKKAGRNLRALCPFHGEKTPSFMVSPELQIFKCFGCGRGGDIYRFLMEQEKIDFPQALKILADRAGVKLQRVQFSGFQEREEIYRVNFLLSDFYHYLLTTHRVGEKARAYLKSRGIRKEAIESFKLGFAPDMPNPAFRFLADKKGYKTQILEGAGIVLQRSGQFYDRFRARIMFPLKDHYGNTIGFSGRVISDTGDMAKYINTPDTLVYKKGRVLYGLDLTKQEVKDKGFAVVVEGELDAISSWQVGLKNVVAIKGSALTQDQAELLSRFCDRLVLALDADIAGDQAARRGIEIAQQEGLEIRVADLGDFKDPDEMAQKAPKEWARAVGHAEGVYDFLISSAFDKFDSSTTEGKARISRTLAPILANIGDNIVQAHCIKQVAERLGVSEEAVGRQVQKQFPGKPSFQKEETNGEKPEGKTRRERIEQHLLALGFQKDPEVLRDKKTQVLIRTPVARRLLKEFGKCKSKKFDPSAFVGALPGELVDFFASLILSDLDSALIEDDLKRELERTKRILEALTLREDMRELAQKMKELEDKGETKKINALEVQLIDMGSRLAKVEAS